MTLKLTLGVQRSARAAERELERPAPAPDAEALDAEAPAPPPLAPRAPELELALAIGTVAERTVAARPSVGAGLDDFAARELLVQELGVAMGALAELSGAAPPDGGAAPAQELLPEGSPAAGPAAEPVAGVEHAFADGALADTAPANGAPSRSIAIEQALEEVSATGELDTERSRGEREVAHDPATERPAEQALGTDREPLPDLGQAVVAVLGLEPAGLSAAITLRRAGARVIGVERSASRLEKIRGGAAELPGSVRHELRELLVGRGFILTEDLETLAGAEYVIVCVPAGVDRERRPNTESLKRACEAVVSEARAGQTILLTSTSYVGSTRELLVDPLEERSLRVGEDVFVAYSGEAGVADARDRHSAAAPLVVGAVSERCYERAAKVLRHLGGELRRVFSPEAAEMANLYTDTFRAVSVALAFEMADACRANGLNPIEVADAVGGEPGDSCTGWTSPGIDGCAVGVNAHQLAQPLRGGGRPATITEEALRKLVARPRQVVWRAQELLVRSGRELAGAPVLVVGASCRAGAADTCQSPALEIIGRLLADGAQVDYHDPLVPALQVGDEWISGVDPDPRRDASGLGPEDYALAIIVTIHPGHDYGWLRRVPEVLDCTYRTPGGQRRFVL